MGESDSEARNCLKWSDISLVLTLGWHWRWRLN